jgi:hypothetical protein
MPDRGDQLAVAAGLDPEHAKSVLGVVERNPLDEASENLAVGCLPARVRWLQDAPPSLRSTL